MTNNTIQLCVLFGSETELISLLILFFFFLLLFFLLFKKA